MPKIASVSTFAPPNVLSQESATDLTRELFKEKFQDIERLLKVFQNGEIEKRHFSVPMDWFSMAHDFEERNRLYIELATMYGVAAITDCLHQNSFLKEDLHPSEIDAIFFISSSGISTPSIDARIMNQLPFSDETRRIPIWGLGCAGGASGMSRAYDYCLAHPKAKVLVLCVELCSLTFQNEDYTKSNLVGASLFADGVACALVCGDEADIETHARKPAILSTASKWMPDSEDVMGWDVKNSGLHVVFSRSIPSIIENWLGPFVHEFLERNGRTKDEIRHFVAHPGGKKVLQAYETSLGFGHSMTELSRKVLREYGNMSSPTVLYVLKEFMEKGPSSGEYGLMAALGPGFSGELLLLQWD